jgi:hypothetical protein
MFLGAFSVPDEKPFFWLPKDEFDRIQLLLSAVLSSTGLPVGIYTKKSQGFGHAAFNSVL